MFILAFWTKKEEGLRRQDELLVSEKTQTGTKLVADENVRVVYSALSAKRTNYDLMLWQAPMISLTAQAFLLQFALGSNDLNGHRLIAGSAATLIGFASLQLFDRHSKMERQASEMLEDLEKKISSRASTWTVLSRSAI